jgi:hypothetical protein
LTAQQVPTTQNADCTKCDPQLSPVPDGTIGAFEGAHYYHCGAYRPEFNCRMRQLGHPYCVVCRKRIVDLISPYLPPQAQEPRPGGVTRRGLGCLSAVPLALARLIRAR